MSKTPTPPSCSIVSFDYTDFDVLLNTSVFYRLAGYYLIPPSFNPHSDLLVILRGSPSVVQPEFHGLIHIYDYVREFTVDYRAFFPNASSITLISLVFPSSSSPTFDHFVFGYLPVFPQIWRLSLKNPKSSKPVHISNFKPMNEDSFQKQLLTNIQLGLITVYGSKWERVNIRTSPLSYLSANRLLSKSMLCFGLMYPYQRGATLSGRMWQAPIQGCVVITEPGTNLLHCPGVLEVKDFLSIPSTLVKDPLILSDLASDFWYSHTLALANDLNLHLNFNVLSREILRSRWQLFVQHLTFVWNLNVFSRYLRLRRRLILKLKHLLTSFLKSKA